MEKKEKAPRVMWRILADATNRGVLDSLQKQAIRDDIPIYPVAIFSFYNEAIERKPGFFDPTVIGTTVDCGIEGHDSEVRLLTKLLCNSLLEGIKDARLVFTNQQQWEEEKKHAKPRKDSRGHRQMAAGKKVNKKQGPGV
jgi:hypothetical protein